MNHSPPHRADRYLKLLDDYAAVVEQLGETMAGQRSRGIRLLAWAVPATTATVCATPLPRLNFSCRPPGVPDWLPARPAGSPTASWPRSRPVRLATWRAAYPASHA